MGQDRLVLAVIKTKNLLGKEGTLYKYHDGNKWQTGSEFKHKNKLEALKERLNPTTPITLDLSNIDETKIAVHAQNSGDFEHKFYLPKNGSNVKSIVDSGATLWEAKEVDHKCCFARSFVKGDTSLLVITIRNYSDYSYQYFEKTDGAWKNVTEKEFDKKMKTVTGGSVKDSCTLDIANPDESMTDISKKNDKGVECTTYNLKTGFYASFVVDADTHIWTASEKEKCALAKLSTKGNSSLLLISLQDSNKYFEKVDEKWTSIEKKDYDQKLKDLKDGATGQSADHPSLEDFPSEESQ